MTTLAAGHHLYPASDEVWRHAGPGDRFTRVHGDHATLTAFRQRVYQGLPVGYDGENEQLAQLGTAFAQRGLLDPGIDSPTQVLDVLVVTASPLAAVVGELLDRVGSVRRVESLLASPAVDEDAVARADVLVSCEEWLPDTRWRQIDQWCATHGTAWHRAHYEGTSIYLGPFTIPALNASYHDLRGRRLAASGVADELLEHWHYLDDASQKKPSIPTGTHGALAVAAGLISADIEQFQRTGRAGTPNTQFGVDLQSGAVTVHPVLPLPITAP